MKNIIYIATSVDAFIAKKDGSIDWLNELEDPSYDFYGTFIKGIGTIAMGMNTYLQISSFGVEWPYPDQISYVFTHQPGFEDKENIKFVNMEVPEFVKMIGKEGTGDLWILGGSNLNGQFLEHGLVDEIIVGIQPVILGEGISLFSGFHQANVELVGVTSYKGGSVQLHYKVANTQI